MASREAEKQERRRARVEAEQREAARAARRRRLGIAGGAGALAVVVVVVVLVLALGGGSDGGQSGGPGQPKGGQTSQANGVTLGPPLPTMERLPGVQLGSPPWPADAGQLRARLKVLGLPALGQEALTFHIHQHLDVFVDGKPVAVPATIGISQAESFITTLHTHDTSGIIHVESPTERGYSLGEFFGVWGVRLDRRCIGGLCAGNGKVLRAWVNGKPVDADPTRVVLDPRQEIVLAYGTPAQMPKTVPSTYNFEPGL